MHLRHVLILLPLALAACGGDEPPPVTSYAALHYEYLAPIHLNVASVTVADHSQPAGTDDVAAQSPASPAQALARMANDRLFAGGASGQAIFTIDTASILETRSGAFDGQLGVHLDIVTAGGAHAGYAEAHVTRIRTPGADNEDRTAILYDLTKSMLADMNVELEFQVRRSLRDWLQTDTAVTAPVQATPLAPPPDATPAPPAEQTAPQQMSPPPGFLRPPS